MEFIHLASQPACVVSYQHTPFRCIKSIRPCPVVSVRLPPTLIFFSFLSKGLFWLQSYCYYPDGQDSFSFFSLSLSFSPGFIDVLFYYYYGFFFIFTVSSLSCVRRLTFTATNTISAATFKEWWKRGRAKITGTWTRRACNRVIHWKSRRGKGPPWLACIHLSVIVVG